MCDTNRIKKILCDNAQKSVNLKVKKYILETLLTKVDQAGIQAPFFIEQLERDILKAEPEGFEKADIIELKRILQEV